MNPFVLSLSKHEQFHGTRQARGEWSVTSTRAESIGETIANHRITLLLFITQNLQLALKTTQHVSFIPGLRRLTRSGSKLLTFLRGLQKLQQSQRNFLSIAWLNHLAAG